MKAGDFAALAAFILIAQAAGILGAFFTADAIPGWYAALEKPSFTPPSWVFGPVWTALYALMGVSAFLVWKKGGPSKGALDLYWTQLALNSGWSIVFFGFRSPWGGVAVIAVLWAAILATQMAFWRLSKAAGILLIPYLAWTTFAAVLTLSVAVLNS